jgi:hypothetical protein
MKFTAFYELYSQCQFVEGCEFRLVATLNEKINSERTEYIILKLYVRFNLLWFTRIDVLCTSIR